MSEPDRSQPVDQTPAPEPSRDSQEGIAARVQRDIGSAVSATCY